jgi:hypothetical protein
MQSIMASGLVDGLTSFALSPIMLSGILLLLVVVLLISTNQGAAMEPAR